MERLAHRLASGVPDGDVERAQRTVQQTARAHPVTASRQPLPGGLRFQDAHADQMLAELARGVADRRHEIGAWIDDVAETFDAIGGRDSREDVPVRIDRSPGRHVGVSDGNAQHVDGDLRDFHADARWLRGVGRHLGEQTAEARQPIGALDGAQHRPERRLVRRHHRLLELALPGGDR